MAILSLPTDPAAQESKTNLCIVGGAGHIGLPLAMAYADQGFRVLIIDTNRQAMDQIAQGKMPFIEEGAQPILSRVLQQDKLAFSDNLADLAGIPKIVVTIGTPVDSFMNPEFKPLSELFIKAIPYLSDQQLLILRSTVSPGTTEWLANLLADHNLGTLLAYCPERVVQGRAIEELRKLPQIVSGTTPEAEEAAADFFSYVSPSVVKLHPMEAEFAKLFCNAYRYIMFAATNQFFEIANSAGLDYARILQGIKQNYPRLADLPGPGLAAGPCLFKDTMQLVASTCNKFALAHAAMHSNEGLVQYLVERMKARWPLRKCTIGLLGMAFKADIDDTRSSLSYKFKRLLSFWAKEVLTTDPLVQDDADLLPLEEVVSRSDILVICVPHTAYRNLETDGKEVVDIWNVTRRGTNI